MNRMAGLQRALLAGIVGIAVLYGYGMVRFHVEASNFVALALVLSAYAFSVWKGLPAADRVDVLITRTAVAAGLAAGMVFLAEMITEYVFLPKNNTSYGLAEYGIVMAILLLGAIRVAGKTGLVRPGILAGIGAAMVASLLFMIFVTAIFYAFHGTARQEAVLRAEGDFEDFARSGGKDLNRFLMEDFVGAGFFHSLLLPAFGGLLGFIGSVPAKLIFKKYGKKT